MTTQRRLPTHRGSGGSAMLRRLAAVALVGWGLAGCAVTFGERPEPDDRSPQERGRDASRQYQLEQQRFERDRLLWDPIRGSER